MSAPHGYQPHIDGLRAIAVSSVFLYHLIPAALPGGYVGVDVFFVISGFLITRIILRETEDGRFSLARFYERRARRILPALALVALATTVAAWLLLMPDELRLFGRSLIGTALFVSNIHFLGQSGYFDGAAQAKPLLHTWSLAVEEQFYLVWPLVVMGAAALLARAGRRERLRPVLLGLVLAAGAASLLAAEIVVRRHAPTAFFLAPFRIWELGAGAALALVDPRGLARVPRGIAAAAALAGLAAVAGGIALLDQHSLVPGVAALAPVLGAALLVAFGDRGPVGRLLASPPFVGLGLISYPVYLWHWPALAFVHGQTGRGPEGWEAVAIVAAVLVLSILTMRLLERPIRARPASTPWRALAAAAAVLLVTVGIGRGLQAQGGWPSRLDPSARAVYEALVSRNPYRRLCDGYENALTNDERCDFGSAKPGGFELAVIGDSQADHWVPVFAAVARGRGWSGRQITNPTCAPLLGARRAFLPEQFNARCDAFQEAMLAFLARNPGLREVVLGGNWTAFTDEFIRDGGRFIDAEAAGIADRFGPRGTLAWHLAATVATVRRTGAEVVLMAPIPHLPNFAPRCVLDALAAGASVAPCGAPRERIERAAAGPTATLERVAAGFAGVRVVRPIEILCDASDCLPVLDGVLAYSDFGHLNARGALEAGRRLGLVPPAPEPARAGGE